jgi:hypothetical protein
VYCFDCRKTFTLGKERERREVVRRHLEDHSSYRTIERRDGPSKPTAIQQVHAIAAGVKSSAWIAKNLQPKWRGVLCMDGTYVRVKNFFAELARERAWYPGEDKKFLHKLIALISTDYHTRDLPHYSIGDNENMIDCVLHFQQLKENGYALDVLVRDGSQIIESAARHVYGASFSSQLCHHHFLDKFDVALATQGRTARECDAIRELRGRVCSIIHGPDIELACQRVNAFHRERQRYCVSEITEELSERFLRDFECLTMYLQYPRGFVPTTVNVAENVNKQLKDRIKPMCMFQSIQSAENYLKLWCLKRRFQKFTDCKKPFTHLNGRAPLEIAGCRINGLDYLNL